MKEDEFFLVQWEDFLSVPVQLNWKYKYIFWKSVFHARPVMITTEIKPLIITGAALPVWIRNGG